jgi:hypothetical protein
MGDCFVSFAAVLKNSLWVAEKNLEAFGEWVNA